jgi:hypothetical protein
MNDIYVHTLRYHYSGRGSRPSRIMFPISYGPFKDEDVAREWIRQRGITHATRLMDRPAVENVKVTPAHLAVTRDHEKGGPLSPQTNPGA